MKDLWALRLQKVQSKVAYESETETEARSSQVFSSQSESEATSASRSTRKSRKRKDKVQEGSPKLVETLALCHTGLLLLRLPVTIADICKWISDGQLLYYRTAREVPLGMRERLPPRYQAQLEPPDLLRPAHLHSVVLELLKSFDADFGMSPPVPNVPLVLYRWLRELMLPIEVYTASKRFAQLLEITFEFVLSPKAGTITTVQYPEARLMAVIVVVTKLLFPFDDIDRSARSETDLSAFCMDRKVWARQNSARKGRKPDEQALSFEESFGFDEAECHSASDEKLDAYLDWYQDNIASEDIRERGKAGKDAELRRAMFTMFPTSNRTPDNSHQQTTADSQTSIGARLRKVQSEMRPRTVHDSRSSEERARPMGSSYRRFREVQASFRGL